MVSEHYQVRDRSRAPQSDNKTPPERTKQEHFFMKHRKHLGTRLDDSSQRKTTPNSFTLGKINMTNHYIL